MKSLKIDIILIISVLIAAFFIWAVPFFTQRGKPASVNVFQDGQKIGVYSLSEDQTVFIPCEEEHYNLLFISNGAASISDADCPDGLCVKAHSIQQSGESIICLPHKLVIQIESEKEGTLDAVTY